MLGSICAVTTVVHDLDPIEHAYTRFLGMRVVARNKVTPAQAAAWGAPACVERDTITLAPETGQATTMRFIADPAAGISAPFTTFGWNATEITVRNTDALAERLAESPFRIIGPPSNLKGFEHIRAMQVVGPAGECLYLTDVHADATLAQASADVGQVFIVVVGGPDIDALSAFYAGRFGNEISDPVRVPIGVINAANKLPADTRHALAIMKLQHGTRVELDGYPPGTAPRTIVPGHLPPGMAIVSFREVSQSGVSCIRGAAGEILELCPI